MESEQEKKGFNLSNLNSSPRPRSLKMEKKIRSYLSKKYDSELPSTPSTLVKDLQEEPKPKATGAGAIYKKEKDCVDELFSKESSKWKTEGHETETSSSDKSSTTHEIVTQDDGSSTVAYLPNGKKKKERNLFNSKSMRNKFLSKLLLRSKKKLIKYGECILGPIVMIKLALSLF